MKRASYREAVRWIADNDSAGDSDALAIEPVSELVSTVLVADLFDVEATRVARDVIRVRTKPIRQYARPAEQRTADRIDGYDRDDLGESPD